MEAEAKTKERNAALHHLSSKNVDKIPDEAAEIFSDMSDDRKEIVINAMTSRQTCQICGKRHDPADCFWLDDFLKMS